jgi:hypothetical protein
MSKLAEPLEDAHGTLGFRGTPVEKHWLNQYHLRLLPIVLSRWHKLPIPSEADAYLIVLKALDTEFN